MTLSTTTSFTTMRRGALVLITLLGATLGMQSAHAQEFPNRPLRMLVPYAAGGPTDLISRLVAQKMGQGLGQTVVVENRPGNSTMIGTRAALAAPPDGYTLLMATTTTATAPITFRSAGFRFEDLTVLAPVSFEGYMISVHPSVPAKNLAEFVAYAKANPGKLNYGSLGGAGGVELLAERFRAVAGLDMVKINYPGTAAALKDLVAGNIQVNFAGPIGVMPLAKAGQIRPLANTDEHRSAIAPNVPTFKEQGYPTMVGGVWFAVTVSEKAPEPVKQRLAQAAGAAMAAADVRDRLNSIGSTPWPGSVQDFIAFAKSDVALWAADIKRLNLMQD